MDLSWFFWPVYNFWDVCWHTNEMVNGHTVSQVIGLHRCNHFKRSESLDIFNNYVLRMLDAKPRIFSEISGVKNYLLSRWPFCCSQASVIFNTMSFALSPVMFQNGRCRWSRITYRWRECRFEFQLYQHLMTCSSENRGRQRTGLTHVSKRLFWHLIGHLCCYQGNH